MSVGVRFREKWNMVMIEDPPMRDQKIGPVDRQIIDRNQLAAVVAMLDEWSSKKEPSSSYPQ
jgi:hypothetical protein